MSPKCRQTLDAAHVAACTTTRRRCLPPRPREPVSMSLHQRWRERPRRRALRLTPACPDGVVHAIVGLSRVACLRAQFVQENPRRPCVHRAARCDRRRVSRCSAGIGSRAAGFSRRTHAGSVARSNSTHHRADDAGAVLGVVNALRFASTRPVAGPAGIDDACARHALATTRWWSPDDGSQRC